MTDETKAANVVEALTRVMRDLPGIGKDQTASAQQGGYAYRGIENITVHAQGLFARHGVVFTPHVRSYEVRDLIVNNKPWTDVYEMVEYTVYGPGGIDDRITVGPILAIGRDNSDKGGNKCLTQAYKYALLQALTISDAKDDGDNQTHEASLANAPHPVPPPEGWETWADCESAFRDLQAATEGLTDPALKAEVVAEVKRLGFKGSTFTKSHWDAWAALLPAPVDAGEDHTPAPSVVEATASPASSPEVPA